PAVRRAGIDNLAAASANTIGILDMRVLSAGGRTAADVRREPGDRNTPSRSAGNDPPTKYGRIKIATTMLQPSMNAVPRRREDRIRPLLGGVTHSRNSSSATSVVVGMTKCRNSLTPSRGARRAITPPQK